MRILRTLPLLALLALGACGDKGGNGGDTPPADSPAVVTPPPAAGGDQPAAGNVVEVRAVTTQNGASGVFEPANITVKPGDVIRWISDGAAAHNVNFAADKNPGKTGLPPAGPYLTAPNATYEWTVNVAPGTYNYQCDPHVTTGMLGTVTVAP
jgi:plastocyanin